MLDKWMFARLAHHGAVRVMPASYEWNADDPIIPIWFGKNDPKMTFEVERLAGKQHVVSVAR